MRRMRIFKPDRTILDLVTEPRREPRDEQCEVVYLPRTEGISSTEVKINVKTKH